MGHRFGSERFGDIANDADRQRHRLQGHISAHKDRAVDKLESNIPHVWDFLLARGLLRLGEAAGPDGKPAEV